MMAPASSPAERPPRPEVVALLRAVKENPDDGAPRLILADWLDEHGDEYDRARAAYLRIEHEKDCLPFDDPRREEFWARLRELEERYTAFWLGPLYRSRVPGTFRQGLVRLEAELGPLVGPRGLAWAATEAWAWVGWVKLTQVSPTPFRKLAESPLLVSLPGLFLHCVKAIPEPVAATLAASPLLAGLASLEVCHMGPRRVLTLLASPHLTRLTRLELLGNGLTTEQGLELVATMPHLHRLTDLALHGNYFGSEFVEALANDPRLAKLRSLRFTWTERMGDAGVIALASSPHLANLTTLHLDCTHIGLGEAAARALIDSPYLRLVTSLRLPPTGRPTWERLKERFGKCLYSGWE